MRRILSAAALAAVLCASAIASDKGSTPPASTAKVPAGAYTLDRAHASLIFKVNHLGFSNYTARFKIQDDLSGIYSYRATINDQWLLMYYDSKTATIWSERLNKDELMKGTFKLVVVDQAGNRSVYTKTLD